MIEVWQYPSLTFLTNVFITQALKMQKHGVIATLDSIAGHLVQLSLRFLWQNQSCSSQFLLHGSLFQLQYYSYHLLSFSKPLSRQGTPLLANNNISLLRRIFLGISPHPSSVTKMAAFLVWMVGCAARCGHPTFVAIEQ